MQRGSPEKKFPAEAVNENSCKPKIPQTESESLQPGGKLYQLAVKENGPLEEGVVYTFRGITDLVFVFESTRNTLVTLSNKVM